MISQITFYKSAFNIMCWRQICVALPAIGKISENIICSRKHLKIIFIRERYILLTSKLIFLERLECQGTISNCSVINAVYFIVLIKNLNFLINNTFIIIYCLKKKFTIDGLNKRFNWNKKIEKWLYVDLNIIPKGQPETSWKLKNKMA